MKDIQGSQRGKCNTCECEEYRTSPTQPGQLRCEYCNHTPVEHVRIIELGACSSCGKDECDKYQSEDPNSYTDCEYCGCPAHMHAGADKLRKPRPQQPSAPMTSGQMMSQGEGASGFQPRYDAHEQPVQKIIFGECKCPGCKYPKRKEGDKIHDFCSRTCAKKFNELQSSFHQQKVAATKTAQQGSSPRAYGQPPGSSAISSGPMGYYSKMQGQGPPMLPYDSLPVSQSGRSMPPGPSTQSMPATAGGKMCSKCRVKQANPGKSWCDQCFMQSQMNS